MASTVLDLDAIVARLVAQNPGGLFKTVNTSIDMNPAEDDGELPALYIYPGWLEAKAVAGGSARQEIINTLVVDILCKVTDWQAVVLAVRDILIGWEMDELHSPFKLAAEGYMQNQAAGPIDIKGGVLHWQERYQNSTHSKLIHNN